MPLHTLPSPCLLAAYLDRRRALAVEELLASRADETSVAGTAVARLLAHSDDAASAALDRAARFLLGELRTLSRERGLLTRGAVWLDQLVRTDRTEMLDSDDVHELKVEAIERLDAANLRLGGYADWSHAVREALAGRTEAHLHDLAGGTGGFVRYLAVNPFSGCRLRLSTSDTDPGYVALGESKARAAKLDVQIQVRNALHLRGVDGVDLFTCMQAVHHFMPGEAVQLISQAITTAPLGILIIDLSRAALNVLVSVLITAATTRFMPLVHDGYLSVRRSYTPAELRLLARLAGATHITARPYGPGHVLLHARA